MSNTSLATFRYTFNDAVKTFCTQALLWHNTGTLPGVLSSHYLDLASSKTEAFGGIPGAEAYHIKNDTPNVDACAV